MKTIYETLTKNISELKQESKFNRSRIFRRARYIYSTRKSNYDYFNIKTWSDALKQSWNEAKTVIYKKRTELKNTVNRLAKQYEVKFSTKYNQEQLNNRMMRAYSLGTKMN